MKVARTEKLPNGNKLRWYGVDTNILSDPDRIAILEALDRAWQIRQEEKRQKEQAWLEQQAQAAQDPIPPNLKSQNVGENLGVMGTPIYKTIGIGDTACEPCTEKGSVDFDSIQLSDGGMAQSSESSEGVVELIEALPFCDTLEIFAAVTEQYSCEAIEEAIALLPQPERSRLQPMWETLTDVRFLQSVTQWSQVTLSQTRLDEAWQLLDATEQNRLHALCQSAQQSVERQWGVTRKQVETGGAFEWVRGGLVRIAYAAADFVRLATGEFVGYHELRLLQ
jgi:hypothetical protein